MRARLIIAGQAGVVIGLLGLTLYQARQLRQAHLELENAARVAPEIPAGTNQRPVRLRLQQLPPINIRTQVQPLDWRSLESEDYATYVANLRKAGCPEETVRDILLADINKLFALRRKALRPPPKDWEFWRHPSETTSPHEADQAELEKHERALTELERERRQLVARLLGPSALQAELEEFKGEALDDPSLQFLSGEKREVIAEALARWRQAREDAKGMADDTERDQFLTNAERALDAAYDSALTPEEREQYRMRSSAASEELRARLRGFGASREEFESLFRLQERAETERQAVLDRQDQDPAVAEKLEALEIERADELKKLLGPERYAEYQRSGDPDFQTLYSLALEHEVPTQVANQVWEMRHAVEEQTDRIRDNPLLSADQKLRALNAIRAETQAAIVDVLGEPLLRDYERSGAGWLNELTAPVGLMEAIVPISPLPPEPAPETAPQPQLPPQQALAVPTP
ncbi:MAG: hypothetical protein JNK85_01475 [Verrucomicrobiales bacterium]|nr:hypothetical protein [Verrucomicrobiales bacterium]